ncbi:hypothetical protein PMAYCL1PPCAC_13433, partial [Pristionchus mayeri]
MPSWTEVIPDAILASLYSYLLIRIAASSDPYFKKPFYTFFMSTGLYSILSVVTFHPLVQFAYTEEHWTHYIYKISYSLNIFGANGATFGKAFMAIHRYFVLKNSDYAEKKWSKALIHRLLIKQFVFSAVLTAPVYPAAYTYQEDVIVALSPKHTLILKSFSVTAYVIYIICNAVCLVLILREHCILHGKIVLQHFSTTLFAEQRNLFIVVIVSSLCYLIKALHQATVSSFTINLSLSISRNVSFQYPIVNGIATYAPPICLVLFS